MKNYIGLYREPEVVVGAKLKLDAGEGIKSMREFKKEIKDAEGELLIMSERFGATSKQALEAAKRVANLKDTISDAKSLTDSFNPDQKFKMLSSSLSGVLGGFSALTGAMGLLGVESQDVQKQLLKVQSALALSQGINQVGEAIQSFKNLGAVIVNTVVKAFSTLKGAIIATGIGALAVGVGILIANFEQLKSWLGLTSEAAEKFKTTIADIKETTPEVASELLKLGETAQDIGDKYLESLTDDVYDLNKELGNLPTEAEKATGALTLLRSDLSGLLSDLAQAKGERQVAGGWLLQILGISDSPGDIEDKIEKNVNTQKKIVEAVKNRATLQADRDKKKEADDKAKKDKSAADDKARKDKSAADAARTKFIADEKKKAEEKARDAATLKSLTNVVGLNKINAWEDPEFLQVEEVNELIVDSATITERALFDLDQARLERKRAEKEESIKLANEEADARVIAAQAIGNALGSLSDLVGKQTAAGKILGIAQATINTWIGVSEVLRAKSVLPEPAGTIAKVASVASIIASGLTAVRNIVKVKVPGAGGGGSAGSLSVTPPAAPLTPTNNVATTRIDQDQFNQMGSATVRAFVVEHDITGKQLHTRRILNAARI